MRGQLFRLVEIMLETLGHGNTGYRHDTLIHLAAVGSCDCQCNTPASHPFGKSGSAVGGSEGGHAANAKLMGAVDHRKFSDRTALNLQGRSTGMFQPGT